MRCGKTMMLYKLRDEFDNYKKAACQKIEQLNQNVVYLSYLVE